MYLEYIIPAEQLPLYINIQFLENDNSTSMMQLIAHELH